MPTFRNLATYADGTPGSADRLLFETAAGAPRGVAPQDLQGFIDVRAFGAVGDGVTDDTSAFEAALDAINDSGVPGTLLVPAPPGGSYRFGSITLQPKVPIRVVGERSRIKRLPHIKNGGAGVGQSGSQVYFTSMFLIDGIVANPHDLLGYYGRVTFESIIFDGDRENQVEDGIGTVWNRGYGNEMMHAVNVQADEAQPWRQPVWFYDCDFEYMGGEGVSIFRNASIHLERCRFYACFRGAFHIVGHWVEVVAHNCLSDDPWDTDPSAPNSGIGTEYEAEGYRRTNKIHIDGWEFKQGFVNVVSQGDSRDKSGQTVAPLLPNEKNEYILRRITVAQGNKAEQVKFYSTGEAVFRISDSVFYSAPHVGSGLPDMRRTVLDGCNIEVDGCTFIASNGGAAAGAGTPGQFIALWVRTHLDYTASHYGHRITNCDFMLDETCLDGDFNGASVALAAPVYAISCGTTTLYHSRNSPWLGGMLPPNTTVENCRFRALKYFRNRADTTTDPMVFLFDFMIYPHAGNTWQIINCEGFAQNGFRLWGAPTGEPGHYEFVGGRYAVLEDMFTSDFGGDPVDQQMLVKFTGFWMEDRYNHITGEFLPAAYGTGRELLVADDPTAAGPVTVTNRLLVETQPREDGLYKIRLEGTPVVAGTLTITNQDTGDAIAFDGAGNGSGDGTGTLIEETGWVSFRWTTPPAGEHKILHSYQHGNEVPGFKGDIAILKSDPSQRWVCTTANAADATWSAL